MILIRSAYVKDLKEITNIYNEAIINTVATFHTKPKTIAIPRPKIIIPAIK